MKKIMMIGLVVIGIILGGTTIVGAYIQDQGQEKEDGQVIAVKESNQMLSVAHIKDIALATYDGHIEDIELEYDDGLTFYEVEVESAHTEYDLVIDAYTGEVLAVGFDLDDDAYSSDNLDQVMSIDEAKKIALNLVDGDIKDIELDEDDGRFEYEIELRTVHAEVDITIDAVTGKILEQDFDY